MKNENDPKGTAKISHGNKAVIPKQIMRELNLKEGDYVGYFKEGDRFYVEKMKLVRSKEK